MATITINGIAFDPESERRGLARAGRERVDASSSDYVLVQLSADLDRAGRETLTRLGAEILEYVPASTYLCRYPPQDLEPLRELPFVRWAHVFLEEFKVSPELLDADPRGEELVALATRSCHGAFRSRPIEVLLHAGVEAEGVAGRVARAGTGRASRTRVERGKILMRASPRKIAAIAALDEVRRIEATADAEPCCDKAGEILGAPSVHQELGLDGAGEIVALCDTGFDRGSTVHAHPAFAGRLVRIQQLGGRVGDDPDGHGTHCAGCIAGDGESPLASGRITGTAPGARLVIQAVYRNRQDRYGGIPGDLRVLLGDAFDDGARVHSNSWVRNDLGNRYNADCAEIDQFVWDHRQMVVICAVGNAAIDRDRDGIVEPGSVLPPGVAKNCIAVGASESERPEISRTWSHSSLDGRFLGQPLRDDLWADNREGMAAFSGRGLAAGSRLKPDLVAPGTAILSTRSSIADLDDLWGPTDDPAYGFLGGTSAAAPLVAGCAAVVRQFLRTRPGGAEPSAALVKAVLINGAHALTGQFAPPETAGAPNIHEGWGRVDLASSIAPPEPFVLHFEDEATELDLEDEWSMQLDVAPAGHPLKATLVWTDFQGEALQNDLDLIVRDGSGEERHGNAPTGSAAFDRFNNVEQVLWKGFPEGRAEILVRAARIVRGPQTFALVVRRALLQAATGS
ncbi:MAG: S8 family serine peptidase [Thermoanaerobaculia bacterium]|nr:S8 family serine peptidase [Thermoanaerobaculia bacterium]